MEAELQWLPALALCLMRPLGFVLLFPMLSSKALGGILIRNALILIIALPIVPTVFGITDYLQQATAWQLLEIYGRELLIGLLIGLSAAIPFWAIDMAGFVIDTMRGASMSALINPLMGLQSSLFGLLFTQVLTILFLVVGGFNQLLNAIYQSYLLLPPGQTLTLSHNWLAFLMQEWQLMFELCLSFAIPAMVIMVLVDLALGLVNRSAQQLNVFFLSMPIKSALVVLLLLMSLHFSLFNYLQRIERFELNVDNLINLIL